MNYSTVPTGPKTFGRLKLIARARGQRHVHVGAPTGPKTFGRLKLIARTNCHKVGHASVCPIIISLIIFHKSEL